MPVASTGRAMAAGAPPAGSGGRSRSAAVNTPATPGMAAAGAGSMARIRPWASGALTNTACSAPGGTRSSQYNAAPVSRGGSSRRSTAPSVVGLAMGEAYGTAGSRGLARTVVSKLRTKL